MSRLLLRVIGRGVIIGKAGKKSNWSWYGPAYSLKWIGQYPLVLSRRYYKVDSLVTCPATLKMKTLESWRVLQRRILLSILAQKAFTHPYTPWCDIAPWRMSNGSAGRVLTDTQMDETEFKPSTAAVVMWEAMKMTWGDLATIFAITLWLLHDWMSWWLFWRPWSAEAISWEHLTLHSERTINA